MHLLYARFWTKVMYDAGLIDFAEPFTRLLNQGVLHAADGRRMSKSKGNVVTPDEVVAGHGTDALRLYILFIGPFEGDVLWDETNIKGVDRFLERYWALAQEVPELGRDPDPATEMAFRQELHRFIKRITSDFSQYKFNTAVAAFMEYLNSLYGQREAAISPAAWREALEIFTQLLCPVAPYITEEIWQAILGHQDCSVHQTDWPEYDEALIAAAEVTYMIQVNGRLRDKITVDADTAEDDLRQMVLERERVQAHLAGRSADRVIVVPRQLVNVVVH
jgi:leucyl-tRNA synthetase